MWPAKVSCLLWSSQLLLLNTVRGHYVLVPRQTDAPIIPRDAQSPRPTEPPRIPKGLDRLIKAQTRGSTVFTYSVGPDETCGYISGLPGAPYTCEGGRDETCVFFLATQFPGAVACCGDECTVRIDCIDYDSLSSSSACDDGCLVDEFTTKCSESTKKFCNTLSFSGGVTQYYCNSVSISKVQAATTTYDGQDDPNRTFSKLLVTTTDPSTRVPAPETSSSPSPSSTKPETSNTPEPTTSPKEDSGSGKSSTPVGPIVGGVVGGVAVIGLIILGLIYLLKKKNKADPAHQTNQNVMQQNHQPMSPGGAPSSHMSFYSSAQDPSKFGGGPPVQTYPSPPPQQMPIFEASASPIQQHQDPVQQGYFPNQNPTSPQDSTTSPMTQSDYNRLSQHSYVPQTPPQPQQSPQPGQQQQPQVPPTVYENGNNWVPPPAQ